VFHITILVLYALAGVGQVSLTRDKTKANQLVKWVLPVVFVAIAVHGGVLAHTVIFAPDAGLSIVSVIKIIAWLLAAVGFFAAMQQDFRPLAGIVFLLSAAILVVALAVGPVAAAHPLSWQLKLHAILSLIAYSILTCAALLAVASLVQDLQLRRARITRVSRFLPPLVEIERLLADLTITGFVFLLLSVLSGFIFVSDLFAQHLVHKSILSMAALVLYGVLVAGRQMAGWRGRRMLVMHVVAFGLLLLSYFGSKFVLETLLDRTWG
jgi:ABC-type uncharacterized transport system permease subunit